ncbi:MAG: DUF1330 domain-containing protein, partial [Gammaproteobacteria bacterium]
MPAYLLAVCDVTNPNENFKKYIGLSGAMIEKHGGKYVVRGPAKENLKGDLLAGKIVIITEWPSLDTIHEFLNDPEYVK